MTSGRARRERVAQNLDQRTGEALPGLQTCVSGETVDAALDIEERVDALDGLQRDRGDLVGASLSLRTLQAMSKKREEKALADNAAKTDIGWGHQIRSYVLQPYQMVKDLRTGVQTSNTAAVLDGDLDQFMEAELARKAFGGGPAQVEDVD